MRRIVVPLLFVCGCAASSPPQPTPTTTAALPPPPVVVDASIVKSAEEFAPTPFTAAQIREACPVGRVIPFRMDMPGKPSITHVMKFVAVDADGADIESLDRDDKGKDLGPAEKEHATWEDLRKHAQFPKSATTIEDSVAETPAGKFTTRVYIVKNEHDITYFHFAMDRPGPPVFFYTERNGERIRSMTLLANADPPLVVLEREPSVACKTDDDCWLNDKGKPIVRPKEHRGKKLKPCHDGEQIPACRDNICGVIAYKC